LGTDELNYNFLKAQHSFIMLKVEPLLMNYSAAVKRSDCCVGVSRHHLHLCVADSGTRRRLQSTSSPALVIPPTH